jgi:transposase
VRLARAHLEHLEGAIAARDRRVDEVITRFARARDRLDTITGVGKRAAETIIAEIGADMSVFYRRPPGLLGGPRPGQQPHRRQGPLGQADQGNRWLGGGC